jgi:hypothetical protein
VLTRYTKPAWHWYVMGRLHRGWHIPPHRQVLPPTHVIPAEHCIPETAGQHGCPWPPHVAHAIPAWQHRLLAQYAPVPVHELPEQHGCPVPPHAVQRLRSGFVPVHWLPAEHVSPAQHACPGAPHATQVPPEQDPPAQGVPSSAESITFPHPLVVHIVRLQGTAAHTVHMLPWVPHAATSVPAEHELPFQHPRQHEPLWQVPGPPPQDIPSATVWCAHWFPEQKSFVHGFPSSQAEATQVVVSGGGG